MRDGEAPSRSRRVVALGYAASSALYIAIGVVFPDFMLSVLVAVAYLLVVAWLVPAGVRRFL
jgi:hypothetical protein